MPRQRRHGALVMAGCAILALITASPVAARASHAFSFVLENGYGFRVDTRAGTVTKDLVMLPDTTIALRLSAATMDSLARMMRTRGLMRVATPFPPYRVLPNGVVSTTSPSTSWVLDVQLDGEHRRWQWSSEREREEDTAAWKALWDVVLRVRDTVERQPAFRALPKPRGGYL